MTLLIIVIALALIFDYINGFHDAANSIATVVSTKVLSPFQAVAWAAFFNAIVLFLCQHGWLGFEFKVADAVAKIVKSEAIDLWVIFGGLIAAITWNLLTWYYGIPSSSSHTLMGGFAGAAISKAGWDVLANLGKIYQTVAFIFLAPLIGMLLAYTLTVLIMHGCRRMKPAHADGWFKKFQLVSSAAFSLGHGSNDAQKVMGIIAAALLVYNTQQSTAGNHHVEDWNDVRKTYKFDKAYISIPEKELSTVTLAGQTYLVADSSLWEKPGISHSKKDKAVLIQQLQNLEGGKRGAVLSAYKSVAEFKPKSDLTHIPTWITYSCFLAIGLGTLSGGWRIIKTMGTRITKVTPLEGVAAETAGAITLYMTQFLGIPVSTTHTITGSIVGVGLTKRLSAVKWGVTINLLYAWILTIPVSGLLGALVYKVCVYLSLGQ